MRASTRKSIALLTLIISFVVGLGPHRFNSKWLAHELDHRLQVVPALADHDYVPLPAVEGDPEPEPWNALEHQLLHAAAHIQAPVIGPHLHSFGAAPSQASPELLSLLVPSRAELEPPFRPPRSLART